MADQPTAQQPRSAHPANKVDEAVSHFNSLLELPSITRATFLPGVHGDVKDTLVLDSSHRSLSALTKRTATQTLGLARDDSVTFSSPISFSAPELQHTSFSPDGKLQALFRSTPANEAKEGKKVVEIWSVKDGVKLHELDVSKEHGDWYFDATFGPPSWHPAGHSLLYTAEAPKPKPDFTNKLPRSADYNYSSKTDFGETFTGKSNPCIFLLVLPSSPFAGAVSSSEPSQDPTCHRLTSSDDFPSTDFGQAVFLPDNSSSSPRILATGYSRLGDDRKLGIVYCANRPAQIFEFELSVVPATDSNAESANSPSSLSWRATSTTPQSGEKRSARSARVLHPPPGAKFSPLVVFISNPVGGPHSSCASLHAVALGKDGSAKTVELVQSVDKPESLAAFPGLYLDQLPQQCFVVTKDGPAVVMSSIWRSRRVPLLVSLKTGEVKSLAAWPEGRKGELPYVGEETALESFNVLGTDGGSRIVALRSGLRGPPSVVVADSSQGSEVEWKVVKAPSPSPKVSSALEKITFTVLPLPKFGPSEIILVSPTPLDTSANSNSPPPLITFPHGGPHSTTTTDFSAGVTCLALAGFRVALVNYPGSLGFGQAFVDELPPKLGKLEVEATLAVGQHLALVGLASQEKGKRLVMGGSHGGWITAHLTARYPDQFDAAVMRNPVIDLPSMLYATDIPDWTYAEATLPYPLANPPSTLPPSAYERLHFISPLASVDNVITPTLLHIGAGDRRVPPDQGRTWYHALKGHKKAEVELLRFEGNGHALDSTVECEIISFESGLRWLERFTKF